MDRIYELMDELADAVKEKFPDYSGVSVNCGTDGYRNITVVKWGKGKVAETTPRRELWEQSRIAGEWNPDRSDKQNEYYDTIGVLLKE